MLPGPAKVWDILCTTVLAMRESIRWVLSNGAREVACILRPLEGSELAVIYYDGLPLGSRVCRDEVDAWQWADEHRAKWEAQGFTGPSEQ